MAEEGAALIVGRGCCAGEEELACPAQALTAIAAHQITNKSRFISVRRLDTTGRKTSKCFSYVSPRNPEQFPN